VGAGGDSWGRWQDGRGTPGWGVPPPPQAWGVPPPGAPDGWSPRPGWPSPGSFPPPGGRPRGGGQGKGPLFAALAGVALLVVLAVVAVATIPGGAGNPLAWPPPSASMTAPPATPNPPTTPETTTPSGGIESIDIAAGECVDFSVTTEDDAEVEPVDCAAAEASHVVVDQVTDPADCPGDVDVTYYETSVESETLALCMDVNWKFGTCYDITYGPARSEQVSCSGQPDRQIEQVETVLRGTTAYDGCSRGGFTYDERRFVVCTIPVR